jgi:probable F420-dependent oxidoreductase
VADVPMKFTLSLAMCPPGHILPLAKAAEESGWDGVALPDSVFFPEEVSAGYPYTPTGERFWAPDTQWVDAFVAIPAIAAATERLQLYTNVYKTSIRQPLLVAKTVSSAAAMFPGRIGIGVGLSWIPEEFAWLGMEMKTRGKRLDETIEILRGLLRPGDAEYFEYHGDHYDFDRLVMSPAPSEHVPLYVGGHSDPALERAAKYGDGWIAVQVTTEEIEDIVGKLGKMLDAHGRSLHSDDGTGPFEIKVTPLIMNTPDDIRSIAALGVTDVITIPWMYYGAADDDVQAKADGVKQYADDVIAPLR